ncbi:RcnB family protein [Acinetobacter tianfuensis]|uniref:RcnB family protein n=1 Tax=Acinetobacter tianfuensis TaxID=2419603 RepID=A0A3A8EEC0_9GAMM|nr:RcnB family protein [Acinetobacter tianfuensis]RKG32438.1 hypothetical protein D7V32_05740 [Acinetobacter tianfuensis]
MKAIVFTAVLMLAGVSVPVFAESGSANYRGADTSRHHRPLPPNGSYQPYRQPVFSNPSLQHLDPAPSRPPVRPYPPVHSHPPHPPVRPYPPQNGVHIYYRAPSTVTYSSNSYGWVNGEPSNSSISSSTHVVISDWRRLGLPDPPEGMYWIFENGRYVLVPNR